MREQKELYKIRVKDITKSKQVFYYLVVLRNDPPAVVQFSETGYLFFFPKGKTSDKTPSEFIQFLIDNGGERNPGQLEGIRNFLALKFKTVLPSNDP